jgi:hypothetical protein
MNADSSCRASLLPVLSRRPSSKEYPPSLTDNPGADRATTIVCRSQKNPETVKVAGFH